MSGAWWKERVFYQIYPRSFQDSNGDGIGDINGIISRLDYLKWLGVGAVWLCPIYDSPNADMGYDIRDYEKIMAEFGTMEDFDRLVQEMHRRDIKLVMDLVVNHSSDEHAWFVESRKSKDNPYRDYYIWRDGRGGREPNNWSSFFTPSAWTYDRTTDQWYLHLFSEKQPDLNWENPSVREEIYAMINRWFDRGVDGFRMDVITCIAKAPGLPDGEGERDENGRVFAHEHFAFQPKLHEYLRELRRRCLDGRDCMCVGETSFVNTENASSLVGDGRELDMLFQFDVVDMDGEGTKWDVIPFDLKKFKRIIADWQKAIDWNTLFWENHDQPRSVPRFGCVETEELRVRSAKMLAAAMFLLRGTPFIYQGEEIGMTNFPFAEASQLRDVECFNLLKEAEKTGRTEWAWNGIRHKGRDNARTPMQWSGQEKAGFTTGEPWIDVNPNYTQINVEKAKKDEDSILHFYRELIRLRGESDVLKYGSFEPLCEENEDLFAYRREYEGEAVVVVCNFSGRTVKLPEDLAFVSAGGGRDEGKGVGTGARAGKVLLAAGFDGEGLLPWGTVVTTAVRS